LPKCETCNDEGVVIKRLSDAEVAKYNDSVGHDELPELKDLVAISIDRCPDCNPKS